MTISISHHLAKHVAPIQEALSMLKRVNNDHGGLSGIACLVGIVRRGPGLAPSFLTYKPPGGRDPPVR